MSRDSLGRAARFSSWMRALRWLGISAFRVLPMSATSSWLMPASPVRAAGVPLVKYYMMPLGLWQYWGMFAPDPMGDAVTLEAEVVDAHGLRTTHEFLKVADLDVWRAA